ncbi:MAG: ribosome biogenesis GTPase Der [Bacteroidetes bacterium RIFCSPLOWO2_12_FULL_37_12]|nr:MAG: ribosome biogenesis GTPase Der [Bacteroidetes bacterium RIFCSPLOWO2_12_FULL_37_12]
MSNILAIVGRPNVGKSTLFNRLTESKKAIVGEISGITRDRHYGFGEWNGVSFSVIDTGGYIPDSEDGYDKAIREQVKLAIDEASVILLMVDIREGLLPLDKEIAMMLLRSGKKIIAVVNKADNFNQLIDMHEFHGLGCKELFTLSAITGSGTGELLDYVMEHFKLNDGHKKDSTIPVFSVLGRPNVGKSTFINALIRQNRNIVSDKPGTTRDSLYTRYTLFNKDFYIVDTAGLRKKTQVTENIEFFSVLRSISALEESNVCLVMVSAVEGFTAQDLNIVSLVLRNKKGLIILVNKWDLVENKDNHAIEAMVSEIESKLKPMEGIPILTISALSKQRIFKAIETALVVYANRQKKISTSVLNDKLQKDIAHYPPPSTKGKFITIKYIHQLPGIPPAFAFFCNLPQYIKDNYTRYLENRIRHHFGFEGVPLKLIFKKK